MPCILNEATCTLTAADLDDKCLLHSQPQYRFQHMNTYKQHERTCREAQTPFVQAATHKQTYHTLPDNHNAYQFMQQNKCMLSAGIHLVLHNPMPHELKHKCTPATLDSCYCHAEHSWAAQVVCSKQQQKMQAETHEASKRMVSWQKKKTSLSTQPCSGNMTTRSCLSLSKPSPHQHITSKIRWQNHRGTCGSLPPLVP